MFNKNPIFLKNKKATVGETITWIIATIIIVIILFVSILATTLYLGKGKKTDFTRQGDSLAPESFFAWLLTEDSTGQTVHEQLKNGESLNEFNGNLAVKIFNEFYAGEYSGVWIGIVPHSGIPIFIKNKYFGSEPDLVGDEYATMLVTKKPSLSQRVLLNEDKSVEMVLAYE